MHAERRHAVIVLVEEDRASYLLRTLQGLA